MNKEYQEMTNEYLRVRVLSIERLSLYHILERRQNLLILYLGYADNEIEPKRRANLRPVIRRLCGQRPSAKQA